MGKTWAGVLLLAAIFAGIFVNSIFLDKALNEICTPIMRAEELALDSNCEDAVYAAGEASRLWEKYQTYSRCFMNHDKMDLVAGLLAELELSLENGSTVDFVKIYEMLDEVSQAEKIAFEWIF